MKCGLGCILLSLGNLLEPQWGHRLETINLRIDLRLNYWSVGRPYTCRGSLCQGAKSASLECPNISAWVWGCLRLGSLEADSELESCTWNLCEGRSLEIHLWGGKAGRTRQRGRLSPVVVAMETSANHTGTPQVGWLFKVAARQWGWAVASPASARRCEGHPWKKVDFG